tara:strand:+ start:760 stop:1953 length:1194 start_codon:yes stop_codon:yes gene_type:complete
MADLHKYKAHEILNKVLNSAETGLQVDIVSGAEYAEDSAHTSADTGNFILGVRNDTLGALGGADGDYVPFQMNASGALYVEVATLPASTSTIEVVGDAAENAAVAGNPVLVGGRYDSSGRTLGDGDVGAVALDADGAVHIADGGNTITVDGTVTANLSSTDNTVLDNILTKNTEIDAVLDTIDADTGAIKTAVEIIDNAISGSEMQVDVVASLPAGSAAIGKLAANDGVDIGDVDVTSVTTGYAAANLGKREDDAHANQDVGVMALAVRNDDVAAIGAADGDYAPLQVNAAGSLYTTDATGEAGSILVTGTSAVTTGISGTKFIAIQFIEDTVFASSGGLVAASEQLYPDDTGVGSDISSNGAAIDGVTFPQGMTIFGRWNGFTLASGKVIGYIGYV